MKYIFETARLRVRQFETDDGPRLYEIHGEEEFRKWIPNECYADLAEAAGAVRFYKDRADRGQLPYVLAVESKETGELIGDTGINAVEGKPEEVEIGYGICGKYRGKGYATELVEAMTGYAVAAFGIRVLYGRVMRGNVASVRVLEKNGYVFQGEEYGAEDDPYNRGMLIYRKSLL